MTIQREKLPQNHFFQYDESIEHCLEPKLENKM